MKTKILLGLTLMYSKLIYAQETLSFGPLVSYNFPLETKSIGLRSRIPITKFVAISPHIKYAPSKLNTFNEFSAGLNFNLLIINGSSLSNTRYSNTNAKPSIYLTGGINYNHWINYRLSNNSHASKRNILPEGGIGVLYGKDKYRFFLEGKYNIIWGESNADIGILFYPFKIVNNKLKCPY